ncbi:hypothetical protein pETSU_211 [Edwardsiella phage pEt-SU]|uniref:Uncharacterized protein n=1 Tax=Edwardsiella phage pEt-SU TaxID=2562142 RepID=A0A4D6DWY3_9CAUD|nr:hypothetical protein HOV39_gp211 [Edwardsiella phage pEt-SU]QBZ70792.1 hypothetical protein pETSU_211 [Edwardsiella phage pEt-SU]
MAKQLENLPDEIETLEQFLEWINPKSIFFGYEGFGKDEMPDDDNPSMKEEFATLCARIQKACPKALFTAEPLYMKIVQSDFFCTKMKYIFTNPKAKWQECIKADLAFVYGCEGEWHLARAGDMKPYTTVDLVL